MQLSDIQNRQASNIIKTPNISGTLVGNKIVDHSFRRCSNYILIHNLTPGFNWLGTDDTKNIDD